MNKLLLATLTLSLAGTAFAEEKKINESEVPKAALDGVVKKYPTAKRVGFEREVEKGKTVYEIKLVNDGRKIDVDVSPEGKIVAEEEEVAIDSAPEAVKKALAASPKYGKWTIKRLEKVINDENTAAPQYEYVVMNGKSKAEVVFAADGKLVKTED